MHKVQQESVSVRAGQLLMDGEYEMGKIGEVVEVLVIQWSITQGQVLFCLFVSILY